MALKAYPLNDTNYTAEDAQLYTATRTSGVYADNHFNISATGTDNDVTIKPGLGWMKLAMLRGIGVANDSDFTINAGVPDSVLPRIDAVVYAYDANANAPEIIIKQGEKGTTPTPPAVIRDDFRHELHLYHIRRRPGATAITPGDITDLRMDANYCGLMADSVTRVDMSAINAQVREFISDWENQIANVTDGKMIEAPEYPGCYYRMNRGVKEWLNPPMMEDVEYPTTKRQDGKRVYAKLIKARSLAGYVPLPEVERIVSVSAVAERDWSGESLFFALPVSYLPEVDPTIQRMQVYYKGDRIQFDSAVTKGNYNLYITVEYTKPGDEVAYTNVTADGDTVNVETNGNVSAQGDNLSVEMFTAVSADGGEYIRRMTINGVVYDLAVGQAGNGAPGTALPGVPGQFYTDLDSGEVYVCMGGSDGAGVYIWNPIIPKRLTATTLEIDHKTGIGSATIGATQGAIVFTNNNKDAILSGVATPVRTNDAVNKQYVDNLAFEGGGGGVAGTVTIVGASELPYGSAPTVFETEGSTAQNRKYTLGIPGGKPGEDGYNPVLGVDYFTDADKAAMQAENLAYIQAELAKRGQCAPEKAESLEWLEANGDPDKIYLLVDESDPQVGQYFVRKKTTQVGGPSYTDRLKTATDLDRVTVYGEDYDGDGSPDGYKTDTRLSGSSGSTGVSSGGMCASGFIFPVKTGDVIRVKNSKSVIGVQAYVISYKNDNTRVAHQCLAGNSTDGWSTTAANDWITEITDDMLTITLTEELFGTGFDAVRMSGNFTNGAIITVNEEISEDGGTVLVEQWVSMGIGINAGNYDDAILQLNDIVDTHTAEIAQLKKGITSGTEDPLTLIRNWDAPIYDNIPVFQLADYNPGLTEDDKRVASIYAKYDALAAAHPDYITKTDLGVCSDGVTHVYRYDLREAEPHHQSGMQWSETKPVIICASGIHWEWGGVYSLYYALKEITENPDLDELRRNVHFVVVPIINPYCFTDIGPYSETYGVLNANGVQIHRNFEVGFIYPGQSGYSELGQRNHGGTEPLSEIETQNIDNIFKEFPDAALFLTCHSAQRDTIWGTGFIWASTATNYTCNFGYRLVDKMSKAWHAKYGETWVEGIARENAFVLANPDTYPNAKALAAGDYRAGHAHVSATDGTETRQATKYGIQGANVEVLDTFHVLSDTALDKYVTTHGAETDLNYLLMYMDRYRHSDKLLYAPGVTT